MLIVDLLLLNTERPENRIGAEKSPVSNKYAGRLDRAVASDITHDRSSFGL